jgi:spore germination protein KA
MKIGHTAKTDVCVVYIEGVADPKIVETVKSRLEAIKIDSVIDSGYLEQYIEDAPYSIFPTVGYSEKPDVVWRGAYLKAMSPSCRTAARLY